MERFHLFYEGSGVRPASDIDRIRNTPGVTVVNETLPRSIVVDVDGDLAKARLTRIPFWVLRQSHPVSIGVPPIKSSLTKAIPGLRLVKKD